jgi:ribosomal protein S14
LLSVKEKYLIRDNLKRSVLIKYKYFNIINKKIFKNRNIKKNINLIIFFKINLNKKHYNKVNNICIKSGKNKSVNKKLILSRFNINYLSILNKLQNFKINSW